MTSSASDDPLVDALYLLIRTGELSPGQRVDQRAIAERLEVSRTPLREALRAMAADGVLTRTPNQGYAVAKFSAADLLQYYALRTFLETQVLRTVRWPGESDLDVLREANDRCQVATTSGSIDDMVRANRRFHFIMFGWSPLTILRLEIERVWRVSDPYRTLHLSNVDRRRRVAKDHNEMITAIEARDDEKLVSLMEDHRAASRHALTEMLGVSMDATIQTPTQYALAPHHR